MINNVFDILTNDEIQLTKLPDHYFVNFMNRRLNAEVESMDMDEGVVLKFNGAVRTINPFYDSALHMRRNDFWVGEPFHVPGNNNFKFSMRLTVDEVAQIIKETKTLSNLLKSDGMEDEHDWGSFTDIEFDSGLELPLESQVSMMSLTSGEETINFFNLTVEEAFHLALITRHLMRSSSNITNVKIKEALHDIRLQYRKVKEYYAKSPHKDLYNRDNVNGYFKKWDGDFILKPAIMSHKDSLKFGLEFSTNTRKVTVFPVILSETWVSPKDKENKAKKKLLIDGTKFQYIGSGAFNSIVKTFLAGQWKAQEALEEQQLTELFSDNSNTPNSTNMGYVAYVTLKGKTGATNIHNDVMYPMPREQFKQEEFEYVFNEVNDKQKLLANIVAFLDETSPFDSIEDGYIGPIDNTKYDPQEIEVSSAIEDVAMDSNRLKDLEELQSESEPEIAQVAEISSAPNEVSVKKPNKFGGKTRQIYLYDLDEIHVKGDGATEIHWNGWVVELNSMKGVSIKQAGA